MKLLTFTVIMLLATVARAISYELDSSIECFSVSSYEVDDWETVHVYMGRAHTYSISSSDRCVIKLYADTEYSYSSRKLKIQVTTAVFDNNDIRVKILDGSSSYSSTLGTLDNYNSGSTTYYTTQPYVYIVVDKSSCLTSTCKRGLNVDLKVTNYGGSSYYSLSTGAIIGIVIGALVGLGLLIGVPICICCCCCAAAASGGNRRQGQNVATITTTATAVNQPYPGTTAYPQQQYVVQGGNVAGYQPQPQYNPQAYQAAAPPPYPVTNQYPQQQYGFGNEAKEGTPAL